MWLIEDGPELVRPELVGRKFARQAELARAGFRVPPLLCVPATVFDDVVFHGIVRPWLTAAGELAERARELRRRVSQATVPAPLSTALLDRFDDLAGPSGLVAVRACVVPGTADGDGGEDSAADPFAGLSDSFLYVRRGQVPERLADCWASAFNPEAVIYRARRGLDPFGARVAVGIQRMAMGTRSFVAFSRDPRNDSDRCVIAAAYGIGEGVVQEKADVDHFFVDHASGEIEAHLTDKRRAVGWDPKQAGQGPVAVPVEPGQAARPVLADHELTEIAALVSRTEEYCGAPQDIEGTITEDGQIHLLQARPIAAPGQPGDGQEASLAKIAWDNNNVTESFPGVSCALTYSVARELYQVGFTDLYRRMGVPAKTLRRNQPLLRQMIGYLDGRIYYQIDAWYRLHGQIRCFRPLWSTWEQSLGLAETSLARETGQAAKGWGTKLARVAQVGEILARLAAHPWRVRRFMRWWQDYHDQLTDPAAMRPSEAAEAYRALWTQVSRRWGVTLVNGIFLFTATWTANSLLRRWLPGADRSLLNGMLCGGPENRSTAAVRSAIALAQTAARSAELTDLLASDTDSRQVWRLLGQGQPAEFESALLAHIRTYGDRGLSDVKLETRTPREEPWIALDTVRAFVRQGLTVRDSLETEREVRARAERELRSRCRNPVKRAVLAVVFRALRSLMRVRENTRFCRSELFGDTRALLMRLGEALADAGLIDAQADVLDLTVEEVLGAFDGTLPGADLRGLAAVRAAERARWTAGQPWPARLETDQDLPLSVALSAVRNARCAEPGRAPDGDADPGAAGLLTGLASSSGVVRGQAKVVLDPSVTAEECRDRILIARETDPGWLFLMMSAKALVVERGTMLSHTAITGRLLGIPTVVSVSEATSLIADGSLIEVDGTAGTVRVLDGAR